MVSRSTVLYRLSRQTVLKHRHPRKRCGGPACGVSSTLSGAVLRPSTLHLLLICQVCPIGQYNILLNIFFSHIYSFFYSSDNFRCFLKNNPDELVTKSQQGVTSGIPARFCNLDKCTLRASPLKLSAFHQTVA